MVTAMSVRPAAARTVIAFAAACFPVQLPKTVPTPINSAG